MSTSSFARKAISYLILLPNQPLLPLLLSKECRPRFQSEFIFRDAKQFTGLSDCPSPDTQRLDFHFNASLTCLNLTKDQAYNCHLSSQPLVFWLCYYKCLELNRHLVYSFMDK